MPVHLTDSLIYQNSWGTPELRALFDDVPRTRSWLEILAALAETQAQFGLIPPDAAQAVATTCRTVELDTVFFEEVRAGFEATNHSTLGLIRALQRRCPGDSGEWLYYGATVQDITDTWTALVLRRVREIVSRELKEIEANLSRLAAEHRDTVMAGRTHGQIGLPITFGFKAAIWAMEVRRHRQRLVELAPRQNFGQLAGGVGAEVTAIINDRCLYSLLKPVGRVTGYDTPYPVPGQEDYYLPNAAKGLTALRQIMEP